MIENWFQNRRARLSKFRDKNFETQRIPKSQDYMLTRHQDTQGQAPNYSADQVSYDQVAPLSLPIYSLEPQEASGECYGPKQ